MGNRTFLPAPREFFSDDHNAPRSLALRQAEDHIEDLQAEVARLKEALAQRQPVVRRVPAAVAAAPAPVPHPWHPQAREHWRSIGLLVGRLDKAVRENPQPTDRYRADIGALHWLMGLVHDAARRSVPAPAGDPLETLRRRRSWLMMALDQEGQDHRVFAAEYAATHWAIQQLESKT